MYDTPTLLMPLATGLYIATKNTIDVTRSYYHGNSKALLMTWSLTIGNQGVQTSGMREEKMLSVELLRNLT